MEKSIFKNYEQRPCKFVFRNGKKVFGVIWETKQPQNSNYYFTSNGDFQRKTRAHEPLVGFPIKLDDLIHAELLY